MWEVERHNYNTALRDSPEKGLYESLIPRLRKVSLGLERQRWKNRGVREELRVVDVSRLDQGLVGVVRREWSAQYASTPPDFPDKVEYCTINQFWLGHEPITNGK